MIRSSSGLGKANCSGFINQQIRHPFPDDSRFGKAAVSMSTPGNQLSDIRPRNLEGAGLAAGHEEYFATIQERALVQRLDRFSFQSRTV